MVDSVAFSQQQHVQAAGAEPAPLQGEFAQALPQDRLIRAGTALIAYRRAAHSHEATGVALGDPEPRLHLLYGGSVTRRAH